MEIPDGSYDGGGDGFDDGFGHNEVDHSDDGQDPYTVDSYDRHDDFDYPHREDYENDADNFENDQLALDNHMDYGDDD